MPGFNSQQRPVNFIFSKMPRLALEHTQVPVRWVVEALFVGVMCLWCEADHSQSRSVKFTTKWSYTSAPLVCLCNGIENRTILSFTVLKQLWISCHNHVYEYVVIGMQCSTSGLHSRAISVLLCFLLWWWHHRQLNCTFQSDCIAACL
jgi:bacterioferritin-associated ferredoxin